VSTSSRAASSPGQFLAEFQGTRVARLETGIYHVGLGGYLSQPVLDQVQECINVDRSGAPHVVIYETMDGFKGYDPFLRDAFQKGNRPRPTADLLAIVVRNPLLKMVSSAISVALRATTNVTMRNFDSVEDARQAGRRLLQTRG
jgi:hypothetical protein